MEELKAKAKKIKLIGTDIDGVWTDARMYFTREGEWMKSFSTYDGMASAMLKKAGILIAILTGENSDIVKARAAKLGIEDVFVDEHEKLKRIKYLAKKYEISMEEIAFIGDDVNDLEILAEVGLSAMVANSPILDKFSPDYVTTRPGGMGAFREFADLILSSK